MLVPHASHQENLFKRIDLNTALQYGTAQGYPPLYLFVREFALTRLHPNIPYKGGAEVILTCGNTDGFSKTIELFTNNWTPDGGKPISQRPGLLCEEFAYGNALQTARPRGYNVVPVAVDAEGMVAYGHSRCLHNVLANWDVEKDHSARPHMMYTVTMGQNPTSGLLSVKRRKEIYEICQRFDVIIVEDDPYFYIQFPHAANEFSQKHRNGKLVSINHFAESNLNHQTSLAVPVRGTIAGSNGQRFRTTRMRRGRSSGSEFLDSLVPSYLSIDTDGRVIRLDTFSKTIAPGCRLGWITAQPAIVERIQRITEVSTQQPSGFVQSLVAELLIGPDDADSGKSGKGADKSAMGWKIDGWIRWLEGLRGNYERRMRTMCETLEEGKYIMAAEASTSWPSRRNTGLDMDDDFELLSKTAIYDFEIPMAGMFLWLHMHFDKHPLFSHFSPEQFSHAFWIFNTFKKYLVLIAPGTMFSATDSIREAKGWQYFRLCFAAVDEKDVKEITERFVSCCHDFWELKDKKDIEKILEEDESAEMQERMQGMMESGKWTVSPLMC